MSQKPPPVPPRTETLIELPPPPFVPPANLAALPGYRVEKLLGQGGMGEVYLAHNEPMDRKEVLKAVQKELLTKSGALERFQQEIRNAARLQHPNIVTAYSCLQAGDALVLAMEYVPGQDLAALVKSGGALPVANAAHYVRQAALGLQHAFEKGMVHRDIKPHNLMLAREGTKHTVKILDFGLAKVTSEKPVDGGLTRDGQMLGTPDYVAPEQTRDAAKADIRSDIYSLGCTLHFLLAGRAPFTGNSLFEILEAHNIKPAPRLDALRPEVPPGLADVVQKMMAKDPAQRYQTPAQVAVALQPFTKPAGKVLMSKPAAPPPPVPSPAGAGSTAPGLSGKTPPPVPKTSGSQWNFEESGGKAGKAVVRPAPAAARKSKAGLGIALGLLAVLILAGGGVGGLYLAGVFSPKSSPTTVAEKPVESETKIEPDPEPKPPDTSPTPPFKGGPKGKGKKKGFDPTPIQPPTTKQEPEPIPVMPPEKKVAPAPVVPPPPPPEPVLAWAEPYNGRDTTGWEASDSAAGTWSGIGGELAGTGSENVTRPAPLLTKNAYRNFVLTFETSADDTAERRLMLRARADGDRVRGYALHIAGRRSAAGTLAVYKNDPVRCLPAWQKPDADVRPATGGTNKWEVACVGPRINVKLNGREVADWELGTDLYTSGGIGFTAAGPTPLRVRNLKLADLPARHAEACRLAKIPEKGRESGATSGEMPFGAAFWDKWQTSGRVEWDTVTNGHLKLTGFGALVSKADAAGLAVSLAATADIDGWACVKLAVSGAIYSGPGVQLLGTGTKVSAGKGAVRVGQPAEGKAQEFKPGEAFQITVDMKTGREIVDNELTTVNRMLGHVFVDTVGKAPNCNVKLDDKTPGKVGLVLKKGSLTISSIQATDKP